MFNNNNNNNNNTQCQFCLIVDSLAAQCTAYGVLLPCVDSLVFNLQFFHDGHLPRRLSEHDLNAYAAQRLRSVQQGGRWRRYGKV